jgi:hypothetical protein
VKNLEEEEEKGDGEREREREIEDAISGAVWSE